MHSSDHHVHAGLTANLPGLQPVPHAPTGFTDTSVHLRALLGALSLHVMGFRSEGFLRNHKLHENVRNQACCLCTLPLHARVQPQQGSVSHCGGVQMKPGLLFSAAPRFNNPANIRNAEHLPPSK